MGVRQKGICVKIDILLYKVSQELFSFLFFPPSILSKACLMRTLLKEAIQHLHALLIRGRNLIITRGKQLSVKDHRNSYDNIVLSSGIEK